jgi:hypothetical protein
LTGLGAHLASHWTGFGGLIRNSSHYSRHWLVVFGQLYTLVALCQENHPRYSLNRRFSASCSRSGLFGEEKNRCRGSMTYFRTHSRVAGNLKNNPPTHGSTALVGLGLITVEVQLSHSDTPHSAELLWTSDRSVTETSTWQHTTITTDRLHCLRHYSKQQSQLASGHRPTPWTPWSPGSAN